MCQRSHKLPAVDFRLTVPSFHFLWTAAAWWIGSSLAYLGLEWHHLLSTGFSGLSLAETTGPGVSRTAEQVQRHTHPPTYHPTECNFSFVSFFLFVPFFFPLVFSHSYLSTCCLHDTAGSQLHFSRVLLVNGNSGRLVLPSFLQTY